MYYIQGYCKWSTHFQKLLILDDCFNKYEFYTNEKSKFQSFFYTLWMFNASTVCCTANIYAINELPHTRKPICDDVKWNKIATSDNHFWNYHHFESRALSNSRYATSHNNNSTHHIVIISICSGGGRGERLQTKADWHTHRRNDFFLNFLFRNLQWQKCVNPSKFFSIVKTIELRSTLYFLLWVSKNLYFPPS